MLQSPKDLIPYFFDKNAKTYDMVAFWATFGRDNYWKTEIAIAAGTSTVSIRNRISEFRQKLNLFA